MLSKRFLWIIIQIFLLGLIVFGCEEEEFSAHKITGEILSQEDSQLSHVGIFPIEGNPDDIVTLRRENIQPITKTTINNKSWQLSLPISPTHGEAFLVMGWSDENSDGEYDYESGEACGWGRINNDSVSVPSLWYFDTRNSKHSEGWNVRYWFLPFEDLDDHAHDWKINPKESSSSNNAPLITNLYAVLDSLKSNESTVLTCEAIDDDGDSLTYLWASSTGAIADSGSRATWTAPDSCGTYPVFCMVDDGNGGQDYKSINIIVQDFINRLPYSPSNPSPRSGTLALNRLLYLSWSCNDPDDDSLFYDVYIGTSSTLEIAANNQSVARFNPGILLSNAWYYWKIVAKDELSVGVESPIWSFQVAEYDHQIIEEVFPLGSSGLYIPMIWIESGTFMMGAQNDEEYAWDSEYPRHKVTISEGFWMGKYEVTQAQWEAVTGDQPFNWPGNPNRPAEMVSWNDINSDFLPALGNEWRLPTEAEWEYACRAGYDSTWFWWGNNFDYLLDHAWYIANSDTGSGQKTHDVGRKLYNAWGLFDMHGNVWEWCRDWHDDEYYTVEPVTDPENTTQGRYAHKIRRGGGWNILGRYCRTAYRSFKHPDVRDANQGLRLVREGN